MDNRGAGTGRVTFTLSTALGSPLLSLAAGEERE
jgi:hypothetical protein